MKQITAFMSNNNFAQYTSLNILNLLRTKIFIDCGLLLALHLILTFFFSVIVNMIALNIVRVIALRDS